MSTSYDLVIIGGGIVGLATALKVLEHKPLRLLLLEAENELAAHQTGHNSGVIHSGLYYKPGSLKATNCVRGREMLYQFCQQHDIPHERCGKVVVATEASELPRLETLEQRGLENGLKLKRLEAAELKDYEPHLSGIAGLHIPETGIVNYKTVANVYAKLIEERGGEIQTGAKVQGVNNRPDGITIATAKGDFQSHNLINCAGLQADRITKLCGVDPKLQIIPFRGEYYKLKPEKAYLVKNLIYPVPDPQFPFLGVHFTRMIGGGIEAGPNAVLAFKREGYTHLDVSLKDTWDNLSYAGFWKLIGKHWQMGAMEMYRSLNKTAYVKTLQRLIPELTNDDVVRAGAGVRAQALTADGKLVDDFYVLETKHMLHVLNAPSPAATASLSIGKTIAQKAFKNFFDPSPTLS